MFTYLINNSWSLIERLVIVGDTITFYVKPIPGHVLGTANIVGGFANMFGEKFNTRTIHSNDSNHWDKLHCCEGDTYYGYADWAHFHFQFSKEIDKTILHDILEYMQEVNKKLKSDGPPVPFRFMAEERAKHIQTCFTESRETKQEKWFDMASPGIAFFESTTQGFMSGLADMFFLQALTTTTNKLGLSEQHIKYLSEIATALMLYYRTDSVGLSFTLMFINHLLQNAGVPQTTTQGMNVVVASVYSACQGTVFEEDAVNRGAGSFVAATAGVMSGFFANRVTTEICERASKALGLRQSPTL